MHDIESLLRTDLARLRTAAPQPPPAWRIVRAARLHAAQRMARRLRWAWGIAAVVLCASAVPVLLHDPRALPALLAPVLLGALACWRPQDA